MFERQAAAIWLAGAYHPGRAVAGVAAAPDDTPVIRADRAPEPAAQAEFDAMWVATAVRDGAASIRTS